MDFAFLANITAHCGPNDMPIRYQKWITREDLKTNPNTLYVFGDNTQRYGLGGQAKEMRGEPNAVGIPTKVSPMVCFRDSQFFIFLVASRSEFLRLTQHLNSGGEVVWPADGIGTGLADLQNQAPTIHAFLDGYVQGLFAKYNT